MNKKVKLTKNSWPRMLVKSVETRKRDVVVRIADWTERLEPAYDVEVYDRGVYDFHKSKTFTLRECGTAEAAKTRAVVFASGMIATLL